MEPITREETYLAAIAEGKQVEISPITREEMYLAKLSGQDVTLPEPVTRKEMLLAKAAQGSGGSGGDEKLRQLITKGITDFNDDVVTSIGAYAFYDCKKLASVNAPKCNSVGQYAFYNCTSLTMLNTSGIQSLSSYGLYNTRIENCAVSLAYGLTQYCFGKIQHSSGLIFSGLRRIM